ncbi:MAG: ATP-binding protein [Candidatus Doudnabacteria bacterium]
MNPSIFQNIRNIDLLSVGIATASIGIMGFIIYFNDKKNSINQTFLALSVMGIFWSAFNYLSYQFYDPVVVIWLIRIAVFFAVWFSFSIFRLFYIFPNKSPEFVKAYYYLFIPITVVSSLLNLTPLVFTRVTAFTEGRVSEVANGPAIALFGIVVFGLVGCGIYLLVKKIRRTKGVERKQLDLIFFGITITCLLLIIFNFILPAFLNNAAYISFGAVFLFPFIALTAYSIIKLHLFDVKVFATEVLTFVLSIVNLIEIVTAKDTLTFVFRLSMFALVLGFGILLIRSVQKEVELRRQLQILDKELEAANAQLKILDQARAEFITIASHQLRTPPATIKWYLASILDGDYGKMDAAVHEQLRKTASTNGSMISLIDDLLNVSRIERGKMEFIFQPTDMAEITQITVDQLLPQAEMRKLQLIYEKPKVPLPIINADKEKLRQVINNLIDNAIKYTPKGSITVQLSQTKDDIMVKVTDTGKGVDKEHLKNVFIKFERGKIPAKNSTGLGLGLYVAKVIVEQHKGKIWVESPGVGKGSSFIFTVPIKGEVNTTEFDLTKTQTPA